MLLISGKLILSKYNTMESITTDCRMFWPGRPLLVSRARHPVLGVGGREGHLVTFARYLWHVGMQLLCDITAHTNVFRAGVTRGLITITMEKPGRQHTSSTAGSRL